MFKNPNLGAVETISGITKDNIEIAKMSPLSRTIYRELRVDEPETIEALLSFYQGDRQHEDLLESMSTETALSIGAFLGKVQNEVLDLVDTTFESVVRTTKDESSETVTHRLNIIPEIEFLDTSYVDEIVSINISQMTRLDHIVADGMKFNEQTHAELVNRISKTMTADTFQKFVSMITLLKIDIVAIYDTVIRGFQTKLAPLQRVTDLSIPYTYIEAIVGYHIAKSLMEEPDMDTRLPEMKYNVFVSAKVNNLLIRYASAHKMTTEHIDKNLQNFECRMIDDVIALNLYEPAIKLSGEKQGISRQEVIDGLLSIATVTLIGKAQGVSDKDMYDYYRRDIIGRNQLKLSRSVVREINREFESFVYSRDFDTWFAINTDELLTDDIRNRYMTGVRNKTAVLSIGSQDQLYDAIVGIVCDVFYSRPGIHQFINDIRVLMQDGETKVHDAVGMAADKVIVKFFVDMLLV